MLKQDNRQNLLLSSKIEKISEILSFLSTKEKITFTNDINFYIESLIEKNSEDLDNEDFKTLASYIEHIFPIILEIPYLEGNLSIVEKIINIKEKNYPSNIINKIKSLNINSFIKENIEIINSKTFDELEEQEILKIDRFLSMIGNDRVNRIPKISMLKYQDFMKTIEKKHLESSVSSIEIYKDRVFCTIPNIMENDENAATQDLNYYFIDEYINRIIKENKSPLEINFILEFSRYMKSNYCYAPTHKNIYQRLLDKLNIPNLVTDVSNYKTEINKYGFSDYDKLLKLVENNYYMNTNIPSGIALFILNKFINDKIKPNETCIKSCLSSIFSELLEKTGNSEYTISFLPETAMRNRQGTSNSKKRLIKIRDKELKDFIKTKDPEIFSVLFHETIHVMQKDNIEKDKLDYNHYQMIKDFIIMTSDDEKYKDYYTNNYKNISFEKDADRYQIIYTLNLLGMIDKNYAKEHEEKYIKKLEQENKTLLRENQNNRNINGNKIKIDTLFDRFIKENPQLLKTFKNKMLDLEYDVFGDRNPLGSIIQNFGENNLINFGIIYDQESFLEQLVNNRVNLNKNEIFGDINSLVLKKYNNKFLDELIKNYLKRQLRNSINTLKRENKEEYNDLFNKVRKLFIDKESEVNIEKISLIVEAFDGNLVEKKELLSTINRR
ncbi:MAG: hypothetical protein PHQ64_02030 [Bacilli bacterium]|nr:hypothetical protein [Bacilli bacterium]